MTLDALGTPAPFLPNAILHVNLLRAFIWYLALMFLFSLGMRLWFYRAVLDVAGHIQSQCPKIFDLINEHWLLILKQGLSAWLSVYLAILVPYSILNQYVWPRASITPSGLASFHPSALAVVLLLAGVMLALDLLLIVQVGVVDAARVKSDLTWSERWLGGNLNRVLDHLGKWNPIKRYADAITLENMKWLNQVFRNNLRVMIVQLLLRLAVAISLYAGFLWTTPR